MGEKSSAASQLAKMGRLYLRYLPDEKTAKLLAGAQRELKQDYPAAQPVEGAKLHLTVLHLGHFGDLYKELQAGNRRLHEEAFANTLMSFIRICQLRLPANTAVRPKAYAHYGKGGEVLALSVTADRQLATVVRALTGDLAGLLRACGLAEPEKFLRRSRNLSHAAEYDPHISLLGRAKTKTELKPPRTSLRFELHHVL